MEKLRDPVKGCPWDKRQTLESIIPHSIEEVYEVAEQIYNKDYPKLQDELVKYCIKRDGPGKDIYICIPSRIGFASALLHQLTPSSPGNSNFFMLSAFISTL